MNRKLILISALIVSLTLMGVIPSVQGASTEYKAIFIVPAGGVTALSQSVSQMSCDASWEVAPGNGTIDVFLFTNSQFDWWMANGYPDNAPSLRTWLDSTSGDICVNLGSAELHKLTFSNKNGATDVHFVDVPICEWTTARCPSEIPAFGLIFVLLVLLAAITLFFKRDSLFKL